MLQGGSFRKGLPKEGGRFKEKNEAEGRTSKKQRDREAATDEAAGDRGGQFPGSQEYSGCHQCRSKTQFAKNCSARNREDQPQKKKFRIRRDLDESDDEDMNWIKEVNGVIDTYPIVIMFTLIHVPLLVCFY